MSSAIASRHTPSIAALTAGKYTPDFRTLVSHRTYGLCPNAAPTTLRYPPSPPLELSGPRLDCHPTRSALLDTGDAARLRARDVPARLEQLARREEANARGRLKRHGRREERLDLRVREQRWLRLM